MRRIPEAEQTGDAAVAARVRPMTRADLAAAAALAGELGYPSTQSELERRHANLAGNPDSALLVAARGNDVVGWIHVYGNHLLESDAWAEIGGLVVSERARGRGVGRMLMSEAEAWAKARGYSSICLRSNVVRNGAHAFYRRLGYDVVKTQHKFRKPIAVVPAE